MDLEQLKDFWQESHDGPFKEERDTSALQEVLKNRSYSTLAKIRRNIWFEAALLLLCIGIFAAVLYPYRSLLYPAERWAFPILALSGFLFYGFKLYWLGSYGQTDQDIKSQLQHSIKTLGRYLKMYRFTIVLLIPLLGAGGVLYGVIRGSEMEGMSWQNISLENWMWIGSVMLAYAALAAWISHVYIKKLYGQHYQNLLRYLSELEKDIT